MKASASNFLAPITAGFGLTVLLLWSLTAPPSPAYADPTIYYVRVGGRSTMCTSRLDPCSSIHQALQQTTAPDDEVWVATGTYFENLSIDHDVRLRGGWDYSFNTQDPANQPTTVNGAGEHVIYVDAADAAVQLEGLTLIDGRDGIHVDAGVVTVTQCIIQDYIRQGVEIDGGTVSLVGNTIRAGEREGIQIDGGQVTLLSNTVENVGRHGILAQGGTVLIENNVVQNIADDPDAEYHGIEISGTHTVKGNQVGEVDHYGIYAHHGAPTIANNIVRYTGADGIHTADTCPIVEIHHNDVYNTDNDGIDARGQTIALTSNVVRSAGKDGLHVDDTSAAHVHDNTIYDADDDCIDAGGDTVFITGNFIDGCGESGLKAETVNHATINANQVYDANQDRKANKAGLNLDQVGVFTVTNNIVADSDWASVLIETTAGPRNPLYHNTLVGSATGQQGIGIVVNVTDTITLVIANNIVVNHNYGISATAGATLIVSNTLLWNNISGTLALSGTLAPPMFVAPTLQDYHLLPESPAIDAGVDVGVTTDVDGHPRPNGLFPDIGSDEFWTFEIYLPLVQKSWIAGTLRW